MATAYERPLCQLLRIGALPSRPRFDKLPAPLVAFGDAIQGIGLRRFWFSESGLNLQSILEDCFGQLLVLLTHLELQQIAGGLIQIVHGFSDLPAQSVPQ